MIRTAVIAATATLAIATPAYAGTGASYLLSHQRPSGGIAEAGTQQGQRVAHRVGGHGPAGRRPLSGEGAPAGREDHDDLPCPSRRRLAKRLRARARHPGRRGDREEPAQLRRPQPGDRAAQPDRRRTASSAAPRTRPTGACSRCAPPASRRRRSSLAVIRGAQRSNGGYSWSAVGRARCRRHLGRRHRAAGRGRVVQQPLGRARLRLPRDGADVLARLRAPARGARPNSQSTSWAIQARHRCSLQQPPGAGVAPRPPAPVAAPTTTSRA